MVRDHARERHPGPTQVPGSNPAAARSCGRTDVMLADGFVPALGEAAYYLVTGVTGFASQATPDPSRSGSI
jgi:hypothetical protein